MCVCVSQVRPYRLLKSSFFLVQSMGGALLLERFWWASSLTCCSVRFRAGMVSVIAPCWKKSKRVKKTSETLTRVSAALCVVLCGVTSGGVFAGGVVSEALDEALDGEGLTDTFESLVASFAMLPFTCKHKRQWASLMKICKIPTFSQHSCQYQTSPQGGSIGLVIFSLIKKKGTFRLWMTNRLQVFQDDFHTSKMFHKNN